MNLLIFILASVSITNIVVNEFIFKKFRDLLFILGEWKSFFKIFYKLISCETCFGFWMGIAIALLFPSLGINWFLGGLISSISCKITAFKIFRF